MREWRWPALAADGQSEERTERKYLGLAEEISDQKLQG